MVDLHSHILPGVDDGAWTIEDSLELGRAAHAAGIETIAATPHIRDDHPFALDTMEERLGALSLNPPFYGGFCPACEVK